MDDDRISQLPEPILNHVISFLSQKDAGQTCILSKSWRHLGPTRHKIEFDETSFPESKEEFMSVVENTLQRYVDQKLSVQEFVLGVSSQTRKSISILYKWIPIVLLNLCVKTFKLSTKDIALPSVVFQADVLEELYLDGCNLYNQINNSIVKLHMLKRLSLMSVWIEDENFETIISSCPLIEHLVLESCRGLSTIRVNKARNLKHFVCYFYKIAIDSIEIDDAPSLETIHITRCKNWYNLHNYYFFPRLKSLKLWHVHLPKELFNILSSNNSPCLEELEIHSCSGFSEFKISNRSIKRLIIDISDRSLVINESDRTINPANIDGENILYFELKGNPLPSITFATTSREWKSRVVLFRPSDSEYAPNVLSTWYLELYETLKALSMSRISLHICYFPWTYQDTYDDGNFEPVVIEHLCLEDYYSSPALRVLLNSLFHKCRPRYIMVLPLTAKNLPERYERLLVLAESIWKILVNKGETRQCDFWKQDLEESSIQVSDKNANEWRPGQECALSNNQSIRFRLKWRGFS